MRRTTCSSCGGSRPLATKDWCHTCYQRWVRHGRPAGGPPARKPLQPCGTDAAYQRHVKHSEPIDDACRDARNAAQNQRRTKSKGKSTVRSQWTAEQVQAARTVAIAAAGSPEDRRLLLEVLGLAPTRDTPTCSQRAA